MRSIDRIRAKSAHVKTSRKYFYEKLEELQNVLAEALSDIDVYAQSKNVTLETISPDDSVYGHLFFSKGNLEIAYRSTEDDFEDSMDNVPNESWSYKIKDLTGCPIRWLERLSGRRAIRGKGSNLLLSLAKFSRKGVILRKGSNLLLSLAKFSRKGVILMSQGMSLFI